MKRLLPLILAAQSIAAFAGTSIPFSAPARVATSGSHLTAQVASNGDSYLAAWTVDAQRTAVYVKPISAAGAPAPALPLLLDPDAESTSGISVSAAQDGYFCSWWSIYHQLPSARPHIPEGYFHLLHGAILDREGKILHTETVPSADVSAANGYTLTAWNGVTHLVIAVTSTETSATSFDNGGHLLQSVNVGEGHEDPTVIALSADASGFLLLETKLAYDPGNHSDLYARRFTSAGIPGEWFLVRTDSTTITGAASFSDGADDVIAWSDSNGLWIMTLDAATNHASEPRQLSTTASSLSSAVMANGRQWFAGTTFEGGAFATSASSSGPAGPLIDLGFGSVTMAAAGPSLLAVVNGSATQSVPIQQVSGRFLEPVQSPPFPIVTSETAQQQGDLATSPDQALAVWSEEIGTTHAVYASRFSPDERNLDGQGIQVSFDGDNVNPAAAFNGTSYLIAWVRITEDGNAIVARRLTPGGLLLDPHDIVIAATGGRAAKVTSNGSEWLVSWIAETTGQSCGNTGHPSRAMAARISSDGAVLNRSIELGLGDNFDQTDVDVGWNGTSYVAAWLNECFGFHQPSRSSIGVTLISPDFMSVQPFAVTGIASSSQGMTFSSPKVAAGPQGSLVAWQRSGGETDYRILSAVPPTPARRRAAFSIGTAPLPYTGTLVAVARNPDDSFTILTRVIVPIPPGGTEGLLDKNISADGIPGPSSFVLSFPFLEKRLFPGHLIAFAGKRWISEGLFQPAAASVRFSMRALDQP